MAWVQLQLSDVQSRMTAAEISQISAQSATPGTIVATTLQRVTDFVRGFVPNDVPLGPEGTLPDKLMDAALSIFVQRFCNVVPLGKRFFTETRQQEAKDAMDVLKMVARGDFRVEIPAVISEEVTPPKLPSPTISSRALRRNRRDERSAT
jgi:hypothetical protein